MQAKVVGWRWFLRSWLILVLLLAPFVRADDEVNPYAPPAAETFSETFDLARFREALLRSGTGPQFVLVSKEFLGNPPKPRRCEALGRALVENPNFLLQARPRTALTLLAYVPVEGHRRLQEVPAVAQNETLRELVREGRILSYLREGNRYRSSSLKAYNARSGAILTGMFVGWSVLMGGIWYDPLLFHDGKRVLIERLMAVFAAFPLAGLGTVETIRRSLDLIAHQMMIWRLSAEAEALDENWKPSVEMRDLSESPDFAKCNFERLVTGRRRR